MTGHRCDDQVQRYLRRLARWSPRGERQGLVLEASRHLYDATLRYETAGMDRDAAQARAIKAFGPAWRVGLAARGFTGPVVPSIGFWHGEITADRLAPRRPGYVSRLTACIVRPIHKLF